MNHKSQSAIEFMTLIGVVLFFFLMLILAFQQNIAEKTYEKRNQAVQELAFSVQNEIAIASAATDGYEREFEIPQNILNADYTINLTDNSVFLLTADGKHGLSLPVQNVTGDIVKGMNTIKKINGGVFLNSFP